MQKVGVALGGVFRDLFFLHLAQLLAQFVNYCTSSRVQSVLFSAN